MSNLGGEMLGDWLEATKKARAAREGQTPPTAPVQGLALDDPAAASTGYGDQMTDRSRPDVEIVDPVSPGPALAPQEVADAAGQMVADAKVSIEPVSSETEEGHAQSGEPPPSESQARPESDMEGSIEIDSQSEASPDDENEETESGDTRDQEPDATPPSGAGVCGERDEQQEALEVEQAKVMAKMFHDQLAHILEEGLMSDRAPDEIAVDYVNQIAAYHEELRSNGWHDHKVIKEAGIMEYTPSVADMEKAIARKKEAIRGMQEKLWKEVSDRWTDPQLLSTLDSYQLPRGIVLQKVLGVSSDEPEQARGKTSVRPPHLGLPNSGEEAMALIKKHPLPASYRLVIDDKTKKTEEALPKESTTSTPIGRQAAPAKEAKADAGQPGAVASTPARVAEKELPRERSEDSRINAVQSPPKIKRNLPKPVISTKVPKTPTTRRFDAESAQNLGDRLSLLEKKMAQTTRDVRSIVKVQENAAESLKVLRDAVETQQNMVIDLTESLKPLSSLKKEMLDAMRDMFAQQSIKKICDERPGPTGKGSPQMCLEGPPQDARIESDARDTAKGSTSGAAGGYHVAGHAVGQVPPWAQPLTLDPDESCLAQRYKCAPHANVGPAMMGNFPAAEKIKGFHDEDGSGKSLQEFINDIWIKRDNYGWMDEQVARLLNEICHGRARTALEMMPPGERATLKSVLRCLEHEFYSEAKQTASSLAFNTRVRLHGESERHYAKSLQQLAVYAYKDAPQSHIESRCREQFMAGLRSMDVKAHLSWFLPKTARVHELVSRAEAFRATREETALHSDTEASAVTVAYVRENQPGKSFAQSQRAAPGGSTASTEKTAPGRKRPARKFKRAGPGEASKCVGKCCFRCGKEGHFIADCRVGLNKCLYVAFANGLPCDDASNEDRCRCACGRHTHFMNADDADHAVLVLTRGKPAK